MYQVIKRDGRRVDFDLNRIANAITRAFDAAEIPYNRDIINLLALQVTADYAGKIKSNVIGVEDIQDSVEAALQRAGYAAVAKSYILYRKNREKLREMRSTVLDYKKLVDDYLLVSDWRVKENSTVTYSVGGLILSNSGAITANYWLSEIYDEEISSAHRNADIHLHDLSMLTGYCAGWSLRQLIQEGLGGVAGKITSAPARHLATLCNQMVNFLGVMQNEWAGAQAFSSFDTYLAPFVRTDRLSYDEVKHCVESFVFGVNIPSRWGTQAPFSNITLDWTVPADLADQPCIVGGKPMDFTYGDCQAEMDLINKAFIEVMIEGDADGRGFQYPIPTYSITKDFDWSETENNRLLFEMTAKYGTPYFSNYINSDMEPGDVRSMCCRLRLDLRELRKKSGGFFGSGESTGSVGVVTINLPRIAYLARDEADFFVRLDRMMDIAARSLKIKRTMVEKLLEEGLYPYTKRYLGGFDNHFSTIGLVGMNEAGLNARWLRKDLTHAETQDFAVRVLNHMRERLSDYQEQYGDLYNLEATPAESTAYRLAKHDKARYPDIITAHEGGTPYYTNSSHLPVGYTEDVFAALDVQDRLQTLYTSGTVFHTFLGEKLPSWQSAAALVRKIAENYELPYYTLSPTYSICTEHGYLKGEQKVCPGLRKGHGGLQPHHRLLSPRAELERRQEPGISGSEDLSGGGCAEKVFPKPETGNGEKDRGKVLSLYHSHLPGLPDNQAAAGESRHSLRTAGCSGVHGRGTGAGLEPGAIPGRPERSAHDLCGCDKYQGFFEPVLPVSGQAVLLASCPMLLNGLKKVRAYRTRGMCRYHKPVLRPAMQACWRFESCRSGSDGDPR